VTRTLAPLLLVVLSAASLGCDLGKGSAVQQASPSARASKSVYELQTQTLEGAPAPLSKFSGQVTLIVNVASECGYTPQYSGLQRVHEKFKARGFSVLGFPSNDFGRQEPGSEQEIRAFCSSKYRVDFPMFAKVQTQTGPGQAPVYAALGQATGVLPSWNFGKYLVARGGRVLAFFPSKVEPEDPKLIAAIEAALAG